MKKALTIIILSFITVISCNKNNNSTGSVGKVGEITIDPTQTTPLSALYTKDSVNTAPVTVTVKGQYGEEDLVHTYPAGYGTEFPIHGMYPEIENTIIVNDGGMIKEQKHNPGVIYFSDNTVLNKYYEMEINKLQEDTDYKNNPSIYLLYTVPQNDAVGISKNGYTRYILKQYSASKAVIDNNEIVFYAHKGQANMNMLGYTIAKYPSESHHDAIKIGDNYLYLSNSEYGVQDRITIIDKNGNYIKELKFGPLIKNALDINKYKEDENTFKEIAYGEDVDNIYTENGIQKSVDWFHANSLVYDSSSDILYVSSRTRGVIAIKYNE